MSRGPGDSIEAPLEATTPKVEVNQSDHPVEATPATTDEAKPTTNDSQQSVSNSDSDSRPSDDDRRRRRGDDTDRRRGDRRHRGDQRRGDYRRRDDEQDRYSIEREENDRRRSRRTRDLVTEDELNGGSDSDSANPSVRHRNDFDRKRSDVRSDDRSRHYGHTSSNYDRYHDNGRSRRNMGLASSRLYSSDDRYRPSRGEDSGRSRRNKDSRSRSPATADRSNKDRSRSPAPAGRRSRSPNGGDRVEGSRGRRSGPGSPREEQKPDADKNTIFVLQLAMRCREKDLERFFAQCGTVAKATLVTDRSGRSKGVGYVEFKDPDSVDKALDLTGQKVVGQPIIVQRSEAQKNLQARTTSSNANMPFHRLHVGNIHFSLSEPEMRAYFEVFGEIEAMELAKGEDGRSKGHGYIQYKDPASARDALAGAHNADFGGRVLRLGLGHDSRSNDTTESLLAKFNTQAAAAERTASAQSNDRGGYGLGDRGGQGYGGDRGRNDKSGGASALDDNEVAGVAMTNHHRNSLMRKLAREPSPAKDNESRSAQGAPTTSTENRHTRCVLLKNMYDALGEDIKDPAEQKALRTDIEEECSKTYGKVVHIALATDLPNGSVYIKFANLEGSKKAVESLNGRWFDQRRMTAEYVADHIYHARYSEAARM